MPFTIQLNVAGPGSALVVVEGKNEDKKEFLIKAPANKITKKGSITTIISEEFLPAGSPPDKKPRRFALTAVDSGLISYGVAGFIDAGDKIEYYLDLRDPEQLNEFKKLGQVFEIGYDVQSESEKLVLFLSPADLKAQRDFFKSLSTEEVAILLDYKKGSSHITLRGERNFLSESDRSENHPNPAFKGLTDEQWRLFRGLVRKAPALTSEITVYRGVNTPNALKINGRGIISTSVSKNISRGFADPHTKCCMLKIKIAPGVKIIGIDLCSRFSYGCEGEIVVCAPFVFTLTGGTELEKEATITPGMPAGRRRKTPRHRRRRSTRRSQYIPIYR
jgi:hypothetical protein